jgi:hypothetical protein
VNVLRRIVAAVMARGVISPGWYAVWTGLAMLFVVWLLVPIWRTDPMAPVAAAVLAVLGLRSVVRGVRLELQPSAPGRHVRGRSTRD